MEKGSLNGDGANGGPRKGTILEPSADRET
jgi:hypothetical protein